MCVVSLLYPMQDWSGQVTMPSDDLNVSCAHGQVHARGGCGCGMCDGCLCVFLNACRENGGRMPKELVPDLFNFFSISHPAPDRSPVSNIIQHEIWLRTQLVVPSVGPTSMQSNHVFRVRFKFWAYELVTVDKSCIRFPISKSFQFYRYRHASRWGSMCSVLL